MRRRALRTLARPVELAGIGLHTGRHARVRLLPAPAGDGVYFVRSDLPCGSGVEVRLPASPTAVVETKLCTTLGAPGRAPAHTIATVEHLLAALCGMDVHACRIGHGRSPPNLAKSTLRATIDRPTRSRAARALRRVCERQAQSHVGSEREMRGECSSARWRALSAPKSNPRTL